MTIWTKLDKFKWKLGVIVGLIVALGFLTNWTMKTFIRPALNFIEFQTEVKEGFGKMEASVKNLSERNMVNSGIDQANMIRFGEIDFISNVEIINERREVIEIVKTPILIFVARSGDIYGWVVDKGIDEGQSVYVVDYQKSIGQFRYADFNGSMTWVEPPISRNEYARLLEEALEKY